MDIAIFIDTYMYNSVVIRRTRLGNLQKQFSCSTEEKLKKLNIAPIHMHE